MTDNERDHEEWRDELKNKYTFYIPNPRDEAGVAYCLWINEGDEEYPVVQNTGGLTMFSSRDTTVGDEIELSEEFFDLVGMAFHEAMCFTPVSYFRGLGEQPSQFRQTAEGVYDGRERKHELWAARIIVQQMIFGDDITPELEPLAEWADSFTSFDVPVLDDE